MRPSEMARNNRKDGPAPASERADGVRPTAVAVSRFFVHSDAGCSVVEAVVTVLVSSHTTPARGAILHVP